MVIKDFKHFIDKKYGITPESNFHVIYLAGHVGKKKPKFPVSQIRESGLIGNITLGRKIDVSHLSKNIISKDGKYILTMKNVFNGHTPVTRCVILGDFETTLKSLETKLKLQDQSESFFYNSFKFSDVEHLLGKVTKKYEPMHPDVVLDIRDYLQILCGLCHKLVEANMANFSSIRYKEGFDGLTTFKSIIKDNR